MKWVAFLLMLLFAIPAYAEPNHQYRVELTDSSRCLTEIIFIEARGESAWDKLAVGSVVLNRLYDIDFPPSICEIRDQPGQFPWAKHLKPKSLKLKIKKDFDAFVESMVIADILWRKNGKRFEDIKYFRTHNAPKGGFKGLTVAFTTNAHIYYKD